MALGDARAPSVGQVPLPHGAVPQYVSAVGASPGAIATVTLTPATATNVMFLTQAFFTATSPAAQQSGLATITDGTWTLQFEFVESTSAGGALMPTFNPPLKGSAPGTAITVTIPAIGSGGTAAVGANAYEL